MKTIYFDNNATTQVAQEVLEENSLKEKMRTLIAHLTHEKEVLTLGQKIQSEAKEEMSKATAEGRRWFRDYRVQAVALGLAMVAFIAAFW